MRRGFFLKRGLNGLNELPWILNLKLVLCGEIFPNIRIFFVFLYGKNSQRIAEISAEGRKVFRRGFV